MTDAAATDRRVRRTQRQLREALVSLILERGWDAVTVRHVCERADVGRSTFYVHYADKESLLLSGFDELHAAMAGQALAMPGPFAFVAPLICHALENQPLFRAVVGRQSGQQVKWRFREVLVALIDQELANLKCATSERSWLARFLAGGFLELMMAFLDEPTGATPEDLACRFRKLALAAVEAARNGARAS